MIRSRRRQDSARPSRPTPEQMRPSGEFVAGVLSHLREVVEVGWNLLEIDAASNTGVDNVRELIDNAQYMPSRGRYKVYLIDEVHMLSKAAFNALLKTLEEPPGHVKFLLATTDPAQHVVNWSVRPDDAAYWFRRAAHEFAIHRWDAATTAEDEPAPIPADLQVEHPCDPPIERVDAAAFLGEVVVDGLEWATPSVGADVIRSLFWPSLSQRTALMRARGA